MTVTRSIASTALLATFVGVAAAVVPVATIRLAQAQAPSLNQSEPRPAAPPPVALPSPPADQIDLSNRTVWHRGETLRKEDDWVESTFAANDKEGLRLILAVQGSVELQSAQVQFTDGQTQSIQIRRQPYTSGEYLLLSFDDSRAIQSVKVVGRTSLSKSAYSVQLRK